VNEMAAKVDEAYLAACKAQGFYPAGYYGHNIHFLWTSSEMEGRFAASLDAARRLVKAVNPVELAATMPQAELYGFTPVATLLRFGRWDAVLAEPAPPRALMLDKAVWLQARGFAHANLGDLSAAKGDRAQLAAIGRGDFSRYVAAGMPGRQMAALALALLDGEIARTSGRPAVAIERFAAAARLEHELPYTEPPYWHQPTSHLLGAALVEAGRPGEAEGVYRESLKTYRRDGWALAGLTLALSRQGKAAAAARARQDFQEAWGLADVKLVGSRF
jgi:tetratricopeptide (TPR) repeat protein